MTSLMLDFRNSTVPQHNHQPLEYYFLHGISPGSFMSAMICGDLFSACLRADSSNFNNIANIAVWIIRNAPQGSYGSEENMKYWMNDTNGHRTTFKKTIEEKFFWRTMTDTGNIQNVQSN